MDGAYRTNFPVAAPAAASSDMRQFTSFKPGSKPGNLVMHTNAAISRVLRENTAATSTGAMLPGNGFLGVSLELNLTHPLRLDATGGANLDSFITPIFDLIASAFVRYRLRKLVFHYQPQAASTDGEQLVFAFAADPVHPILWNATPPDANDLLALADSKAFMPWKPWSMDVTGSVDTKTIMYTYSDPATSVGTFTERFSDFGVISCVGATPNQSNLLSCGVLYMESEIELMEFCPISVTRPSAAKHLTQRLSQSAASSSSYGRPVITETETSTAPDREIRRRCEELVRKIGELSPRDEAFFRANWSNDIQFRFRELYVELQARLEKVAAQADLLN